MIKVWLSGANSQIGKAINDIFCPTDLELFNTDKEEVDVTDLKAVMNFAQVSRPVQQLQILISVKKTLNLLLA